MANEEQKAQDEKSKSESQEAGLDDEAKLSEIMEDRESVRGLLTATRESRAVAKEARQRAADAESRLEKLEKIRKDADDKALQEQGKFKELAEKNKTEAEDLKKTFAGQRIDFELKLEAQKAGIIDAGDAVRLCDRAGLKLSDDFATVEGAKEAVEALRKAKPYLFAETDDKVPPPGIGRASLKSGAPLPEGSAHDDFNKAFAGKKK